MQWGMNEQRRCGIYHGIVLRVYYWIYHGIDRWYISWYVLNSLWCIAYYAWYIPDRIYPGIYHTVYTMQYTMVYTMLYTTQLITWYVPCYITWYMACYIPYGIWHGIHNVINLFFNAIHHVIYHVVYTMWFIPCGIYHWSYGISKSGIYHGAIFQMTVYAHSILGFLSWEPERGGEEREGGTLGRLEGYCCRAATDLADLEFAQLLPCPQCLYVM
jgi:hypothetical protein